MVQLANKSIASYLLNNSRAQTLNRLLLFHQQQQQQIQQQQQQQQQILNATPAILGLNANNQMIEKKSLNNQSSNGDNMPLKLRFKMLQLKTGEVN